MFRTAAILAAERNEQADWDGKKSQFSQFLPMQAEDFEKILERIQHLRK